MRTEIYITSGRSPSVQTKAAAEWTIIAFNPRGIKMGRMDGKAEADNVTNKKVTLMALRDALKRFHSPAVIKLFVSDPFVRNMLKADMPRRWSEHDWKLFRYNREIRHLELWQEINELLKNHAVSYAAPSELPKIEKEI